MTTMPITANGEHKNVSQADKQKGIDNHKMAARHHQDAANSHLEAAKHHEDGNYEKAAQSTIVAQDHHSKAHEAQKEVVKQHAVIAKH